MVHRRTGLERTKVTKLKNGLLAKRVIKQKKGMIGFNKHFNKWKKGMVYTTPIGSKRTMVQTDHKVGSKQTTTVGHTDHKNAPKVKSSAEVERLKKERKKEIPEKDISDKNFELFWEKYPKKNDSKKAAKTAWDKHYLKGGKFTLEKILEVLAHDIKEVFSQASENKYIPGAGPWLNRERWEDFKEVKKKSTWNYGKNAALDSLISDLKYEKMKVGVERFNQQEVQSTITRLSDAINKLKKEKENA
jgi:hypothetical protein